METEKKLKTKKKRNVLSVAERQEREKQIIENLSENDMSPKFLTITQSYRTWKLIKEELEVVVPKIKKLVKSTISQRQLNDFSELQNMLSRMQDNIDEFESQNSIGQ